MTQLTRLPEWQKLIEHKKRLSSHHMRDLFQANPQRFQQFSLSTPFLLFDYSKNIISNETLTLLLQLADAIHLPEKIEALFAGQKINNTEELPALHTALRNKHQAIFVDGQDVMPAIQTALQKIKKFTEQISNQKWLGFSNKPISDIVNIGIGGSDLGPRMATHALSAYHHPKLQFHFIANIDGTIITQTLKKLNPETTLFIISSKSFSTVETLTNAKTAKEWFIKTTQQNNLDKNFIAVTGNVEKAINFGISTENIFPLWDWVGGRYSLWSAIGLPIALAIGMKNFEEFLEGAYYIDQHFQKTDITQNIPLIMGLLNVWYRNFFDAPAHAILPYDERLKYLPAYLQQAKMESQGKRVKHDGKKISYKTGQIIFGETGTNGQHSFHQLLHQGTQFFPVDFIAATSHQHELDHHHTILLANALSQSKTLMEGKTKAEILMELQSTKLTKKQIQQLAPHKVLPGNRPNNFLLFSTINPFNLGALIAIYEHSIFVESAVWQINAFDQWGVENGKKTANEILPLLENPGRPLTFDDSTNGLIEYYRQQHGDGARDIYKLIFPHK
jgi:glucose-6-phosphate isomerase